MGAAWTWLVNRSPFAFCLLVGASAAVFGGAVWGLVRGVSYPPTVVVAVIEGAVLIGVPGSLVALLVGAAAQLSVALWRRVDAQRRAT